MGKRSGICTSCYIEDHTHPIEGTVAKQCVVIARSFLELRAFLTLRYLPKVWNLLPRSISLLRFLMTILFWTGP